MTSPPRSTSCESSPTEPHSTPETGEISLPGVLDEWLAAHEAELIGLRRYIHAHPELSGEEHATAKLLAARLSEAGLGPRMLPAGNGVICDISGTPSDDGIVALRGDLDALPLSDVKDVPYRSTVEGVCHACGHDVHATLVVGAGLVMTSLADRGLLPGTVRLLLQPSEERFPGGALSVIEAGGLDGVSAVFAMHCDPHLETGFVGIRSGALTAAADEVEVRLSGVGGHTARPHLAADLVNALGRVVVDVPALLSRRLDPRTRASVVFGTVAAGQATNVIPREAYARGTVRVLDRDAACEIPDLLHELVHAAVAGTGAQARVKYIRGVPPVTNDQEMTAVMTSAVAAGLGTERVVEAPVSMGGEDFAWYQERVPGVMARLGVGRPGEALDLHTANFDIDESAISHGVRALVHTALAALKTRVSAQVSRPRSVLWRY